jgi:hypothetical protein
MNNGQSNDEWLFATRYKWSRRPRWPITVGPVLFKPENHELKGEVAPAESSQGHPLRVLRRFGISIAVLVQFGTAPNGWGSMRDGVIGLPLEHQLPIFPWNAAIQAEFLQKE